MKTTIYTAISLLTLFAFFNTVKAQFANTTLSNLTDPTAINLDLQPDMNKHNLGSLNLPWNNLFLGNAIYIDGSRFIAFNTGSGTGNTAIGKDVLFSDVSGFDNTGVGYRSLYSNTTGNSNTALGWQALFSNDEGEANTAVGSQALMSSGAAYWNTAVGYQALMSNTQGLSNVAVGLEALFHNLSGSSNVANGFGALSGNTSGNFNTACGEGAGDNVTNGSNNTFIGSSANCGTAGTLTNSTAIGYLARVTASNHVVIGNSSVTHIGGFANWSNLSDGRVKKNIKQNVPGLSFINKLQPITYNLDIDAVDKIIDIPAMKDKNGKTIQPSQEELDARKQKEQIVYTGFVAQDVEKTAKSLNFDFSGVDRPDNANTLYSLRYGDFVVPLVKAVQELSKMNDAKDASIDSLRSEIGNLSSEIESLKAMIVGNTSITNTMISSASLSQNIPNPFNNSTTINYAIPKTFSSARIVVTDKNGIILKQINLSSGKGSVNIDAATLSSGAYQYSLYVDDRLINTKQMIIGR